MPWIASTPCKPLSRWRPSGFCAGGRKLGLSPSGVTRLIAALEERLGARLLQRTTRQVALTDVGARYLERSGGFSPMSRKPKARRRQADAAERTAGGLGADRIRAAPCQPVMSTYLTRYPEVFGGAVVGPHDQSGRRRRRSRGQIGTSDSSLVARHVGGCGGSWSPHPLSQRYGEPRTPQAIASHETIQFGATTARRTGLCRGWQRGSRGVRRGSPPSADAAIQYAEQDGGLTRCWPIRRRSDRGGRLRIVLQKFRQPPLPIHIVYPTSRLLSAGAHLHRSRHRDQPLFGA
jgi:DNA-binding transcriptional LysR family regulator